MDISLAELASDPEFMSSIIRHRPTVGFVTGGKGKTRATYAPTALQACVQVGQPDNTIPANDAQRFTSWIMVISVAQILIAGPENVGDIVEWTGGKYRVMKAEPYPENGFFVAYAQQYSPAAPTTAPVVMP